MVVYSVSKRFDQDMGCFLIDLRRGYVLELLEESNSEGSCTDSKLEYLVYGIRTMSSWGCSRDNLIAVGCL